MKKLSLAILAISLGTAALAVQIRQDTTSKQTMVVAPDPPPPDCAPMCGN